MNKYQRFFCEFMKYFLGILVFFLAFGWLVLLFSAVGLFYTETVVLSIIVSALITMSLRAKRSNPGIAAVSRQGGIPRNDKSIFYLVILISLVISLATCYFATPTIFGGRDQGSIATAAIELSKYHTLKITNPISNDLFQKYGPGRSLNFPGFDYTKDGQLISRFPIGYTAYLSSAYSLFGPTGIQYSNFVPLFLFLVIFWITLREFFDKNISFLGFLLAATFFPFFWFAKYTLTEIYSLFLAWSGIYFLIRLAKEKHISFAWLSLAFFGLSSLTRIEGIAFFVLAVIYIFILQKKKVIYLPKNFSKYLMIIFLALSAIYLFLNFPSLLDSTKNFAKAFLPNSTKDSAPSTNLYAYLGRIFFSYNILPYVVLGLIGILWAILSSRAKPRDLEISRLAALARNDILIIFFITFPAFFYLVSPMITLDDPWIFRRFVFAVFPVLIFYSIYTLSKFFYHKSFLYFTLMALVAANIAVSSRYLTLSENQELLPQIEKISQEFGSDDLILVDREATGSGFSLMSEPLRTIFDKNAVYFFNADDLKHVNQNRYKNIYLIAKFDEEKPWYSELIKNKQPTGLKIINNNYLEPSEKKFSPAVNVKSQNFLGIWKLK